MNTLELFTYEAEHGMQIITDYHVAVAQAGANAEVETMSPVEKVAIAAGRRVAEINHFLAVYKKLKHPDIQKASKAAKLSLSVILDLANAIYPLRKHKERNQLVAKLCTMLEGLTADQARVVMTDTIRKWAGDSTKRPDSACMHKRVGIDGKRRLVAVLSAPIADRIDTILHRLAERIKEADPSLQFDQAYATALIQKLTSTSAGQKELFGPMFMINTDYHFHHDGKISTTDGTLVDIRDVVNEKLAPTGWAAVTGTTDDNSTIPLVGAFVKVRNRFASTPQRLAAILETLVCAWPGCDVAASKCQTHHITAHKHGGATTGLNLTPLCKFHNGKNDDNPGQHVNGRIERDSITGRPGLRLRPDGPLLFNNHPATAKTITAPNPKPKP